MKLSTAIDRVRHNPLDDVEGKELWKTGELVSYFNEKLEELCEETLVLVDSDTPEICQQIIGIVASNMTQGTNPATLKVVNAFAFRNINKGYTFPITDNIPMTDCVTQAISTYCRYLISTDKTNTVTVQKGNDSSTASGAYLPLMTSGLTPIAMLLVQTDASHTFTSGTNSLNDTGITATFESSNTGFSLDSRVVRLNSAQMANYPDPLDIKDKHWMNRNIYSWKTYNYDIPKALVYGATLGEYLVWPSAKFPDQLLLTVARRPLVPLSKETLESEIELPDQFVKRLYNGVAALAYLKRDADTFDPTKSANHHGMWLADIDAVKREIIRTNQTNEINQPGSGFLP